MSRKGGVETENLRRELRERGHVWILDRRGLRRIRSETEIPIRKKMLLPPHKPGDSVRAKTVYEIG